MRDRAKLVANRDRLSWQVEERITDLAQFAFRFAAAKLYETQPLLDLQEAARRLCRAESNARKAQAALRRFDADEARNEYMRQRNAKENRRG